MLKKYLVFLLCFAFSSSYAVSDIDIASQAMNKAIQTQIRYETLQEAQDTKIKELKGEVGELKFANLLKESLIVILAIVKITH